MNGRATPTVLFSLGSGDATITYPVGVVGTEPIIYGTGTRGVGGQIGGDFGIGGDILAF